MKPIFRLERGDVPGLAWPTKRRERQHAEASKRDRCPKARKGPARHENSERDRQRQIGKKRHYHALERLRLVYPDQRTGSARDRFHALDTPKLDLLETPRLVEGDPG